MKRLCLVLICFVAPLQLGAADDSRPWKLAYDFCAPVAGESGYETACEIRLQEASGTMSLMAGVEPAWAPDGRRVAAANYDIYLYTLAPGSVVNLTNRHAWYGPPRWSPDNRRMAFASNRDGALELYVMNADGSAQTQVTRDVGVRGPFAWSPDGVTIAFTGTVAESPELFLVAADGSNLTRLTYDVAVDSGSVARAPSAPSWSPDGTRIAFDCANDICAVNADGSGLTQLTNERFGASGAVFSPVDGRIAFAAGIWGDLGIAVRAADGDVTQLTPGHIAGQHAWSPSGGSLAFVSFVSGSDCSADGSCIEGQNDGLYTVNSDGTGLAYLAAGAHHPHWATALPGQPVATFTSVCDGAACQFDATGSYDPNGSIASYYWNFGDGTTSADPAPFHAYAAGSAYHVTLVVTDAGGDTDVSLKRIAANAPPVASFTVVCSGPSCTFDGSASSDRDGTLVQYSWHFGVESSAQGPDATVTYKFSTGTYLVTLVVQDNGGATASTAQTVTVVNALPVASFTMTCTDLTCTFDPSASSDADGPVVQYHWQFGTGATAYGQRVSYVYPAGGAYTATLTVWDDVWQSASSSRSVTVTAPIEYMHVGDIDGAAATRSKTWDAFATIQVHSATHAFINGVTVSGSWSDGTTASCTTNGSGACTMSKYNLPRKTASVAFTVKSAVHATLVDKPSSNHDPDGDSNGTVITISR